MDIVNRAVRFSFLTAGPMFELQLPIDFGPLPWLSSPLRNGIGGRSFDFVPTTIDQGLQDGSVLIDVLEGRDGRFVELYERPDPPLTRWLRWQLSNGAIYTHIREVDELRMASVTATSLSIVEDPAGGPPVIMPEAPLRVGASTRPGYQEIASFLSPSRGDGWTVVLQRPSFVPLGSQMIASGDPVAIRAGSSFGIEVQVLAGMDRAAGETITSALLASLAEV
ncbi:MAG: hypothetical protein M3P26_15415 [Gemmatimonadota bacterium]|nr:hypothetical protein [Gemmatimonadota bacterium]